MRNKNVNSLQHMRLEIINYLMRVEDITFISAMYSICKGDERGKKRK